VYPAPGAPFEPAGPAPPAGRPGPSPTIALVVASTFVVNPVVLVVLVLFAGLAFLRATAFRRLTGRNPWGIHPVVWLVLGLLFGLIGSLLCLIAVLTSKGRATATGGDLAGGGGPGADRGVGVGRVGPPGGRPEPAVAGPPTGAPAGLPAVALPGWQPDPSGRHQHRYWSGAAWTDYVSDDGVATIDPPG
jgi:hypothetical protein